MARVTSLLSIIKKSFVIDVGANFISVVARWWISNNKNVFLNIFSSAVIWSLWTLRNELCFQGENLDMNGLGPMQSGGEYSARMHTLLS
jgi:hypothetical protein